MNILSQSTINSFTGEFQNHFDTFKSIRGPITVNKEPIRVVSRPKAPNFGYAEPIATDTYIPVYQNISGIIIYPKDQDQNFFGEGRVAVPNGDVTIKVDINGKNYIESGKNEYFQVEGVKYNQIGESRIQNYFGLRFYYYTLKRME